MDFQIAQNQQVRIEFHHELNFSVTGRCQFDEEVKESQNTSPFSCRYVGKDEIFVYRMISSATAPATSVNRISRPP